jgi:hypothetical protein
MIESLAAPSLAVGSGAYVFVNNMLYAEMSAYGSLSPTMQTKLGSTSPPTLDYTIDGLAPYYRLAVEPVWGEHSLMFGAYGMSANILPGRAFGDDHAVTLRSNYIWERQIANASVNLGAAANGVNYLRSLKISGEYVYDHMYSFTATYFQITGNQDALRYTNNLTASPNSGGWIFDAAYLPFMRGGPKIWPWLNTRLGVNYTRYNAIDGSTNNIDAAGRKARENNTVFLYAWTMW